MSEFEGPPLRVVAKRTELAEKDFALWRVSDDDKDKLARRLKEVPVSKLDDRYDGDVRLRRLNNGFEVAFILVYGDEEFVILVIGYDREGEMESRLDHIKRAGLDALNPGVKTLLEGKKRKNEL